MTLEQLAVVSAPQITFDPRHSDRITVEFTPTVPHCGMSTFIGEYRIYYFSVCCFGKSVIGQHYHRPQERKAQSVSPFPI